MCVCVCDLRIPFAAMFSFALILFMCGSYSVDCILFPSPPSNVFNPKYNQSLQDDDVGTPLILTPYIERNETTEARNKARVFHTDFLGIESYSGYFTVDKRFNSNLFFWFFPAEENYSNAPVILWLQGGPGDSTFTGLLAEHGAFNIVDGDSVELRLERWSRNISVIYIDSPVGTGFSYTNDEGYCQNVTIVGNHLYDALQQFYQIFPELIGNDFYAAGESYGGKYGPAIAYAIHKNNPTANVKINLKGIALDSGYSDPVNMVNYADYLYQTGLIDTATSNEMKILQRQYVTGINNEQWSEAGQSFIAIISLFLDKSGMNNFYNYLKVDDPVLKQIGFYNEYLQKPHIRKSLHVGNTTFNGPSDLVYINMQEDLPKSVAPWISELLKHYRLMTYNGMFDVIVAYALTDNYLQTLKFSGDTEFKNSERRKWYVDEELAGWVKQGGNVTEVLVRNSGHVLIHDQPRWCYNLINKFITYKNFP